VNCHPRVCPECGDRLIHQSKRGRDESSSAHGQHIHDDRPRTFDWMDGDGIQRKRANRMLHFIEHKFGDRPLSDSQKRIMPVLARLWQLGREDGIIHQRSGVWVVHADPPWVESKVAEVTPDGMGPASVLRGEQLASFETGEPW